MEEHACGGSNHGCGSGGHGMYRQGFLKKVLLMMAIIIITFWAGVQLGEMTGKIKASRGEYRMMGGDWDKGYKMAAPLEAGATAATPAQ